MVGPPPRVLGGSALLTTSYPPDSAARDLVQHHIVVALAQADDPRLVFKGGTMLRVCALPDYRFSEDLDFDWRGSANGFQAAMVRALPAASASSGAELDLVRGGGPNPLVLWLYQGMHGEIKTEATLVQEHEVPTRRWPVQRNYPSIPGGYEIDGYDLVAVAADKLSCVSRRAAPRDFYDLHNLLQHGVDIHAAWELYVEHFQSPTRQYGRRPHPSDLRASYLGRRRRLAERWASLTGDGRLPADHDFHEAFVEVDVAVMSALSSWKEQLPPGELHRLKQEHQHQWGRGRGIDGLL